jgi:DNA polymerase-4
VLATSPEAEAAGISRGMAVRLAKKVCPDLVIVPPNPRLYARASRALHELLARWAPVIEPRWYGHAFLDLTGTERLFGPAVEVAARIRREAEERLRLPLWVGVATNKVVSEAATRSGRADAGRSDGRTVRRSDERMWVPAGSEASFLAPRIVSVLPDVPDPIRRRLDDYQLDLIGEIAAIPEPDMVAVFGAAGRTLRARANGIDLRPVLPPAVRAEFQVAHTLATDTNDLGILHELLRRMAERLGRRLRERGLAAGRLAVAIDYADAASAARAVAVREAALDVELWDAARRALAMAQTRRTAVRQVAVTVDRLVEANLQLDFWTPTEPTRAVRLQGAADKARQVLLGRWGSAGGARQVQLGR